MITKKESLDKMLEKYYNNDPKYNFNDISNMMDQVNKEKEVILTVEEVNQRKKFIFHTIKKVFSDENYKEKEINLIKEFLDNTISKKDRTKYYKFAAKVAKKRYFFYYLNKWMIKNHQILNDPYYDKLREFIFDFNPIQSCETYFEILLKDKNRYINVENVEKMLKKYNIPLKAYLIYLVSNLPESYTTLEEIKYNEVKKYIDDNFKLFLDIIDIVSIDSKIDLLTQLYLKKEEETLEFLLGFSEKATSKKLKYHVTAFLSGAYENYNKKEKKEFSKKIIELLKSKKKSSREIAVYLLIKWNLKDNKKLLTPLLDDKSKEIVEMITLHFATNKEISHFTKKAILLKAKKIKKQIDLPENTPLLIWKKNSSELDEQFSQYIIYLLKDGKKVLVATESSKEIISLITEESFTNFINFLYENIEEYEKKSDWFLRAIPFTKDDRYILFLENYIKELISNYRGAAAAKIVPVIASFKTTKAIQLLDKISLKKNARDARVNRVAIASLDNMAKEMNLTKDDLLDYIIPTFGFSKEGILNLDFGSRQFEIKLQPDLSFTITDNKEKKYKNLPKVGKNDDKEMGEKATQLFKSIKKNLKKQVKLEKERLERGFSTARVWSGKNWLNLFINNPIMRVFALNLIWGRYENEKLLSVFRYNEDGSFLDVEDNDIKIRVDDKISLVHPIELSQEELDSWKEVIEDYEIVQPFNQINREIYQYDEKEKDSLTIKEFEGYMIGRFALKNGMNKFSWQRGIIEDAGGFYSYNKNYSNGYSFVLNFLGDYIGNYDDNKEVPLYDIAIYKNGKPISLKKIPKRLYSELHYELKLITDKGSGFNEKWQLITW